MELVALVYNYKFGDFSQFYLYFLKLFISNTNE